MTQVTEEEIKIRLAFDNPWWDEVSGVDPEIRAWPRRAYFGPFLRLIDQTDVRRAVVLMGPRRVGKTVMIGQAIQHLIDDDTPPRSILYTSLDTPTYFGLDLERLVRMFREIQGHQRHDRLYVFFDEIQYLKDWEVLLKSFVDSHPTVRCVASGSAAAALRLKSIESGAGRFTDFLLPPLTFAEYLRFVSAEQDLIRHDENRDGWAPIYQSPNIAQLNDALVDYLNFGGYPEAVFSEAVRQEASRYIRSDIIDKVLLRDLPSLYGVSDIQELNRLFATLAYRTGAEVSYEALSNDSGIAKNTLRRYLEYLEAAFLIRRFTRVDQNGRRFKRETAFKVYLTNPSIRSALFGLVSAEDEPMGRLVETAIYDQWTHAHLSLPTLHYARWKRGEVDFVLFRRDLSEILDLIEVKWSDRQLQHPAELRSVISFAKRNHVSNCLVTTRTAHGRITIDGVDVIYEPSALYCYRVGRHAVAALNGANDPAVSAAALNPAPS